MKLLSKYAFIIFIVLLANAIILEQFLNWGERHWRVFGLNTFNFIVVVYSPLVLLSFLIIPFKEKLAENKIILLIIFFYAIYQLAVNLPLTIINFSGHVGVKFISELSLRLSLLQIPLFYLFLFSKYNNTKLINWFTLTSVLMIIFAIYNYTQGQYFLTNTGEIRLLSGVASIFFTITIFNNLKLLGAEKNNYILVILMFLGIVLTVHRSVYLTIIIIFIIYILLRRKGFKKFGATIKVSLLLSIIISLGILIPGISELFISRSENIAVVQDYNYQDRFIKNILAYEMFLKYPINGTYLTGFYYDISAVREEFWWRPHNFIFEILPTQGIVGILFIFSILITIFRLGWKNINDRLTELSFFILLYYVLISLTNATFFYNSCTVVLTFFSALILWRNKVLNYEQNSHILK